MKKYIDTFIIISSDSDLFKKVPIKENNKNVIIVGHSHTPDK